METEKRTETRSGWIQSLTPAVILGVVVSVTTATVANKSNVENYTREVKAIETRIAESLSEIKGDLRELERNQSDRGAAMEGQRTKIEDIDRRLQALERFREEQFTWQSLMNKDLAIIKRELERTKE